MMGLLLGVMLLLVVKSLSLDGAIKGVEFYLVPDFNLLMENESLMLFMVQWDKHFLL